MGGTSNWDQYRLAQIWEMVRNESTAVGERQAQAWTTTAELCEDQANQLERAAAQLAQTWVPAPGSAAEAFQYWLGNFTRSMRGSAAAARANSATITDITYQMVAARTKISGLVAQNNQYQSVEQASPAQVAVPGWVPPPVLSGPDRPPLGWRNALDQLARDIMLHTESTVVLQANRMQIAEGFDPNPRVSGEIEGTNQAGPGPISTVSAPSVPKPTFPIDLLDPAGLGVVLGDAPSGTDASAVLEGAILDDSSLPAIPSQDGGVGLKPPPAPPTNGMINTPMGPAMAPGGVIGAPYRSPGYAPPTGSPTPAARPASGAAAAGRGTASALPMSPLVPPGAGQRAPMNASGAGRLTGNSTQVRRPRSVDDPWSVEEGGPAILEPPPEPLGHDPGPGVIGIDR